MNRNLQWALSAVMVVIVGLLASNHQCTARTLLRESFEGPSAVSWLHAWGNFAVTDERAKTGKRSLKCTVENQYGMSVHFCDFPARAGATYTLTAFVFVPRQEKECHPCLQICKVEWPVLSQASPKKRGEWEELRCHWTNRDNLKHIRVALHNAPWKEGLGGASYYWDDIVLMEEGGIMEKSGVRGHNPDAIEGLEVTPAGGMKVAVAAGKARVLGREVKVEKTTLEIAPQVVITVTGEASQLTDEVPEGWGKGTALTHCNSVGTTLPGCLEPGSIAVKDKEGGGIHYEKDKDWRADELWGRIGRLPEGRIKAGQTVFVDYRARLLRVDTVCVSSAGKVYIRQGDSEKMCPSIPGADYGSLALCNIFLPYGCKEITEKEIYPIGEASVQPDVDFIESQQAHVAKTRAKLESGQEVTIVAWGDSVTAGGDATRPEFRFPDAFAQALRYKYPRARINLINAGRGGWSTNGSLPLFQDDVLKYKPDLVTMEFINDMGMTEENLRKNWFDAIDRVRAIGGEAVIITPHFAMPTWMGLNGIDTPETRAGVTFLRKISEEKQVALADASKRWERLAAEGVPYVIHLRNGINHPDDAGHQLFVDELMRLF